MTKFFIILIILVGCTEAPVIPEPTPQFQKFKLSSSEIVECSSYGTFHCGMTLSSCINKQEYRCQTNIQIITEENTND
jgi:hypothetical protein